MRWVALDLVEFKYDEAHITMMALRVARGQAWPLLSGGTTLGLQRPALDVYLLALPLWLTGGRPEAGVWLVGGLGVAATALTYALGKRMSGEGVGLVAAFFMAANPWLALYDRKVWAHIQVALSVLLLWLAWEAALRGRRRAAFWFPVTASLQLLTHTLALVQGLSWLGAILAAPRRWWKREFAWGMLLGAWLLAPYLAALVLWFIHAGPRDVGPATGAFHFFDNTSSAPAPHRWLGFIQVFGGWGLHALADLPVSAHLAWRWLGPVAALVLAFILLGVGLTLSRLRHAGERAQQARLLLAWAAGPTLALMLAPLPVYPQYWTVLLPLPALFFGMGVVETTRLLRRVGMGRYGRAVAAAMVLIIFCGWTLAYANLLTDVEAGAGAKSFGVPLRRWRDALVQARVWAQRLGTDQVRVAVHGVDPAQDGDAAVVAVLIGNPPWARFVAPSSPPALLLSETSESLYFWAISEPEGEQRLQELGEMVWEGRLADGLSPVRLYRLPPASTQSLNIIPLEPPPKFDVGLELVGYAFQPLDSGGVEALFVWRVDSPREDVRVRDFTAFNHILQAQTRERMAQTDGMAALSRDWWPGDILVQPYRASLEPGSYVWRTGLYSRVDGARSQLLSGGDAIELPFTVR